MMTLTQLILFVLLLPFVAFVGATVVVFICVGVLMMGSFLAELWEKRWWRKQNSTP